MDFINSKIVQEERILVTGSGGFIGTHLVDRLQTIGANLFEIRNRQDCDLRNIEAVKRRFQQINPSIVIHLAASPDLGQPIFDDGHGFHNTITCTLNVLHAMPSPQKSLFIYVGSYKQYGNITVPFRENDKVNPINAYGRAKHFAETLVRYYEANGLKAIYLRMGPIFGPRQSTDNLIPSVIYSLLKQNTANLVTANVSWTPLYVSDAIEAICSCIFKPKAWGRVINIGGDKPYTPKEIMNHIAKLMNTYIEIEEKIGNNCSMDCLGDISLAKQLLDWNPQISLSEGLQLTIDYFFSDFYSSSYISQKG